MKGVIPGSLLTTLSEFVADKIGLYFPEERLGDLAKGLGSAAKEFGFKDREACARWLMSTTPSRGQIEVLARYLSIGETYFFRDAKAFEALELEILPQLIDSRRKSNRYLRIWSAGCATGEEPYSLAILLTRIIPDIKNWNITLLATDINPLFLKKAENGIFGKWSFRNTPAWVRAGYFKDTAEGKLELRADIRSMVAFEYHNLAQDKYPSLASDTMPMDLILCRNVLMYFTPRTQKKIIQKLSRGLIEGGLLLVGPVEISYDLCPQLMLYNISGTTFYRKKSFCSRPETPPNHFNRPGASASSALRPYPFVAELPSERAPTDAAGKTPTAQELPNAYNEAMALYNLGRYNETAEKIEASLTENQGDTRAMSLLAMSYANQGRLSDALVWAEKAAASDKMNPYAHYFCAVILDELDRIEEAIAALRRSLYLDPSSIPANYILGSLLRRQGRLNASNLCFRNTLSLLSRRRHEEVLWAIEGLTVGRLIETIQSTLLQGDRSCERQAIR